MEAARKIAHGAAFEERRREILRTASRVFGEKGTANVSLRDLADELGMTHAGILHYFGSKRNLLIEVIKFRDEADLEDTQDHVMPHGLGAFRHLIRTAYLNEGRSGIVQTYVTLSSEATTANNPGKDYFVSRYSNLRQMLITAFQEAWHGLGSSPADMSEQEAEAARLAAISLIAVMDGLQLQWLLDPAAFGLGQVSEFAINTIADRLLKQSTPAAE